MDRMFKKPWALALLLVGLVSGCTINRDIMFKTDNDHVFDTFPDTVTQDLRIQPNDVIEFRLFANDGFKMIDLVTEGAGRQAMFLNRMVFSYNVEFDGLVKLPLLGRVPVSGRTVREAETFLEGLYTEFYNRPFVQIQVINRRVVVFPGGGGDARSIPLENNNTTLLEAIGLAGGVARRGDARRVKLFRLNPDGGRSIYQFDLSTIDGMKYGDIVLQGDDVIYVQPNPELAREVLYDLQPIVTLLTSLVLVFGLTRALQ
jgi:polysaccharide export outer membrane protein